MRKTKDKNTQERRETSKKVKHGTKLSIGDIIFRVLILIVIFLISSITYVFYVQQKGLYDTLKNYNITVNAPIKEKD